MERTLRVLDDLKRAGVIAEYAIGGAMAAIFYTEPILTFDLDVFVRFSEGDSTLLTLQPIYDALSQRGFLPESECVNIEGIPVQFLPAYNALVEEGLKEAREVMYEAVSVRVLRVEHLIAICIQTGREKDRQRLRLFLDEADIDLGYLHDVIVRHGLESKWKQWTA